MSDLIQRLRDMAEFRHMDRSQDGMDDIMREAADEIERRGVLLQSALDKIEYYRMEFDGIDLAKQDLQEILGAFEPRWKYLRLAAINLKQERDAERHRHAEVMEEVRKVLGPFAARRTSEAYINNPDTPDDGYCAAQSYTAGDYRAVRALLSRLEER